MKKGHFFIIWWVAGAGKWTLTWNLRKLNREDFYFPLSYITRKPRPNEEKWVYAHFITEEEFKKSIESNEFLEYAFVHKWWYYWTKANDIVKNWINAWLKVIKEMEYQWVGQIQKDKEFMTDVTTIFLDVPDEELIRRIKKRDKTISEKEVENRLESAKKERKFWKKADYKIITTITKEEVLKKALEIINKHNK